ncbi:MAG: putative ABC transporter permease [Dorea sp.]
MSIYYALLCFVIYGFLGWCGEVIFAAIKERKFINRGFLNSPICPIYGIGVVCVVHVLEPYIHHIGLLYVMSVVLTTVLEYVTGVLLERIFHHRWWDYSNMPLNINGHICILFSLAWGLGCVIIVKWIHPFIFRGIEWLPIWLGNVLNVASVIGIGADIYVTVTGIFQMNRRLSMMEDIAKELHEISEHLGSNLSRNVLEGIERQEEIKEKLEEKVGEKFQEQKEKALELGKQYKQLSEELSKKNRRVLRAFPKMKSLRYKDAFEDMKKYLQQKK